MEEQQYCAELMEIIGDIQINTNQNCLVWRDGTDVFTVKHCFKRILSAEITILQKWHIQI